jgi:hypothetical protein
MVWCNKRADNRQAAPGEFVSQFLGQEQSAPCLRGGGEDYGVPGADPVNRDEIPTADIIPGVGGMVVNVSRQPMIRVDPGPASLVHHDDEKFTESLDGNGERAWCENDRWS